MYQTLEIQYFIHILGIRLTRTASKYRSQAIVRPSEEHFQHRIVQVTEKLYKEVCEIRRLFTPIDLNECHWGLLVVERILRSTGVEERMMTFGYSLGYKFPIYIKQLLAAVIDSCYSVMSTVWSFPTKNYILDHLGYTLQQNYYSYGM